MTDAMITAEKLLKAGAVKLNVQQPYTWASGWRSPIYCDNRKLLSLPFTRDYIKSELANVIFENFTDAEVVAGVATAGIPWGAMVADQLKLPFVYVRSKPKEHGLGNQIEGDYSENQKVIVVEDLISTGKSSLQVVEVLKGAGLQVEGIVSIFSYGFQKATAAITEKGLSTISLTNYETLLKTAVSSGTVREEDLEVLLNWSKDPAGWVGVV